jgi:uroporphyrinogen decarboxylase
LILFKAKIVSLSAKIRKAYKNILIYIKEVKTKMVMDKIHSRKPDFTNILKVLENRKPERPTLFEFIISEKLCIPLAGYNVSSEDRLKYFQMLINAFYIAGYDYFPVPTWHTNTLEFPKGNSHQQLSRSQNEGALITDWESYEKYSWPDINNYDYSIYSKIAGLLPEGMKLIAAGPGGVLENATDIVGYENLCYISMMDEKLTAEIFSSIGKGLLKHYEIISSLDSVCAVIGNDDWGFKTQTMFPTEMLREYVFPWHKKIVNNAHSNGKKAILHSCGNLDKVMDDVIDYMGYDGKHSFEDQIIPVEDAYQKWGERIAILGGIDLDFIARSSPSDITERVEKMIEMSSVSGGYALGSGNSIPDYVPFDNFLAILKAIKE